MKIATCRLMALAGLAAATLMFVLSCHPQGLQSAISMQGQTGSRSQNGFGAGPEIDPVFAAKRMRALNADRQKSMVSDAEKLLKLAKQLDTEIASNPTDQLTAEEMRELSEIEKLARSVKTKMAQSFGGAPQLQPPPIMPIGGPGTD